MNNPLRSSLWPALALAAGLSLVAASCGSDNKGGGGTPAATGGSGGSRTGGSGGSSSGGTGGSSTGGTGGSSTGGTGGSSTGGTGGSSTGGTGGTGTGGSDGGAETGGGETGGGTDGGGDTARETGGGETASGDGGTTAAPTFTKIYTEILVPGCTAPGACHTTLKDQYFIFAEGMQMRSHMLLVPSAPNVGTIPMRVNTLLSYVTPQNPAMPNVVRMPPQSGPNLGTPPVMKPPLTAAQVAQIRAWAMNGAKND